MSYTQNDEERIILDYFKGHVGTFCDLGANDGITFSNTRALAERGWRGVLVDADPEAFSKLEKLYLEYKGLYTYNYAITDYNGKKILQKSSSLLKNGDTGLVSTFNASEMERFKKVVNYTPIEVQCYTWRTALNRWAIQEFDFISADIEGEELKVLPDIDLSKTKCICIEHNGRNDLKTEYEKYLHGFKLIYTSAENLIYVR
ncbi:MAG TPA: FkbM family methyltransferase [Cyclobacteriaceae bacterium]|nr:FkbM family methyltransferase [Cyclobacteriaceae bacterium]